MAEPLLPGNEILVARRAFPEAQLLFEGPLERRVSSLLDVGWYGTDTHPESGAFALVRRGGPYDDDLIGEVIRVRRAGSTDRDVLVFVVGARDIPEDIALYRRAFAELGALYLESLPCVVEVQQ